VGLSLFGHRIRFGTDVLPGERGGLAGAQELIPLLRFLRISKEDTGRARMVETTFSKAERGEDYMGAEQVIARKAIRSLPASMKADLARSSVAPELLGEGLRQLQELRVQQYRQNPSRLTAGDIAAQPLWDVERGDLLHTVFHAIEAPARLADHATAQIAKDVGRPMTLGQAWAGAAEDPSLLDNPDLLFRVASGTVDAAKMVLLDPAIALGSFAKALNLRKVPHAAAGVEKLIASRAVGRWAERAAAKTSPTEIIDFARVSGSDLPVHVAREIAEAPTTAEVLNTLRNRALEVHAFPTSGVFKGKAPYWRRRMPIVRAGSRVWQEAVDINSPHFVDDLTDAGRYLYGDDAPAAVDRVLNAPRGRQLDEAMKFWDEGLASWAERNGISAQYQEAAGKLGQSGEGFWAWRDQAFGMGLLPDGIRPRAEMPWLKTQLRYTFPVPSYRDLTLLKRNLRGVGGKALESLDRLSEARGLKSAWLMNPRYVLRNSMEEVLSLLGHPEFGGVYFEHLREGIVGLGRLSLAAGRTILRGKGARAVEQTISATTKGVQGLIDEGVTAAKNADLPLYLRSRNLLRSQAGYLGPVSDETLKLAKKEGIWDWHVWRYHTQGETPGYLHAWHHTLNHQLLGDRAVQEALAHWDDVPLEKLKTWAASDAAKTNYFSFLPKEVREAPNWAEGTFELIRQMIPEGEVLEAARRGAVPLSVLERNVNLGPKFAWGPVPVSWLQGPQATKTMGQLFTKGREKFFDVAGAVTDYVGRVPGYKAAYEFETNRVRKLAQDLGVYGKSILDDDIDRIAGRYAAREIPKYADSPVFRTRAGEFLRSVIGFGDARLRFWTRWARVAVRNPPYVEGIRLLFGGGENLGWIQTDERGTQTVQIPVMAQLASKLVGKDAAEDWFRVTVNRKQEEFGPGALGKLILPKGVPFSVKIFPGFMPVLSLPVDWLTLDRPGVQWLRRAVLGDVGERIDPNRSWNENLLAHVSIGWLDKIVRGAFGSERDLQFGNSVKDALAYLAYKGEDVSDPEVQEKARNLAKLSWITKGLTQAVSPWSPSEWPFKREIVEDWREWRAQDGPELATQKLFEKYGEEAWLYTVPRTQAGKTAESASVKPPVTTKEAEDFYRAHKGFFEQFPQTAGYFTTDMDGEYDFQALSAQIKRGQRVNLPPDEWIARAMYLRGNREYYEVVRPQAEAARVQGASEEKVSRWLSQKRFEIDEKYPGWLTAWSAWSQRQEFRQQAIDELRVSIHDPAVAETDTSKAIAEFMRLHDQALLLARQNGDTSLRSKRYAQAREVLAKRASEIAERYKSRGFESVYRTLFQNELEDF
jgi:hypothetical protein